MEIVVGKTAGFCFGVKNAVTQAEEELEKDKEIYCLGELVHNAQVIKGLETKGAKFIDNIEEAQKKVIIRAHGIPKETYEKAKKLNVEVIDFTCPKVLNIHKIAEEYSKKNYFIFITGKKEHPETIGTVSFCNKKYYIIENVDDIDCAIQAYNRSSSEKLLIISQTTFNIEKFDMITDKIKKELGEKQVEIKNTICMATQQRQEETIEMAKNVDIMIIVGGKNSSNSNKLYDLAKEYCENVFFIETEEELETKKIKNANKIGIMAGASTPYGSIEKTIEKIKKM